MGKFFIWIILPLLIPVRLYCQDDWSLEKCIKYALENNISVKQQELNARISKTTALQSKMNVLPTINLGANQNFSFGRSVDPYTNEFATDNVQTCNFSLSSSLTIFNGFQALNSIKKTQLDLMAGLQDVEKAKNDLSLNIASAYLQILFNKELLAIAESQLSITNQQVERTRKLVDAGSLAQGNLLEIQAQEASEELQVVNSKNQLSLSYLTLTQLLDLDTVDNFKIVVPDLPPPDDTEIPFLVGDIYNEALKNMPQIKSAEIKSQSAGRNLAIAKGRRSPRLSLSMSYGTGYSDARKNASVADSTGLRVIGFTNTMDYVYTPSYTYTYKTRPFEDQFKDNASTSVAFNFSIPVFNNWTANTAISNAKVGLLSSQYTLQLTKNQLYKEIQQSHADAIASLKKYMATKKAVSSMEESFKYTQQKFDVGMVNSVDYNLAKNKLTKAKSDLLQAKYEYIFKMKILDFYRGNPIKL